MISIKYLIYHDLIGFQAYAKLKSKIKKKEFIDIGIIIDETRDMLISERDGHVKKYIKKDYIFRFKVQDENGEESILEVQGYKVVGLPVNRLRSLKKRRWFKK